MNNKYSIKTCMIALLWPLFFIACTTGEPQEGDGNDHGAEAESAGHAHEHGEENVVELTGEQMKAVGVSIGQIEQKQLERTLKANGVLRVPNGHRANATAMFGGVIQSLSVELGDQVRKGQVVATITNPQFVQLQEEYLRVNSQMIFAEQEAERQQELNKGNIGAMKNLQNATAKLHTLQTQKASLSRQIRMMGIHPESLSNSNLRSSLVVTSPINGTVREMFASIGSYVDVSSPIAEIIDNSALHVDLQVYEKDIPAIAVGQRMDFVVTNNPVKTYQAEVYNIGASFNGTSKTIAVHSRIVGEKSGLIDGMNITGMLGLSDEGSPAVPNDAVVHAEGKYYIFVVKENDEGMEHNDDAGQPLRFEKIEVMKGPSELGYTAITALKDIPEGASVVVKGAFFVQAKMDNSGEHAHAH